ncbi:MAG TPA: L-histidine N(alpha)-methyltransferase, partial [Bryobacteraceae bacterium]|nr:L-histidine N(alpha)-methyltransferase [Bryobacteraceae bacterium]
MKVEVVLTEADIAQEFVEAIEARDLPEKFFYWFPRSAAEWIELIGHAELYGGLWRTWKELAAGLGSLSGHFKERAPVISFGAGDGARDRLLMDALKKSGTECCYFPVDASQTMLEMACAGAEDADIETVGIKADISSPVHLVYAADAAEPPRIFILSGNTMGSFDPLAEIRYVAQCMKPEDRLIVDGEIHDPHQSMARRDNPAARKFISTLLANVGISGDDGEIRLSLKRDDRHEGLHLVTRSFGAGRDLSATVAGQEIPLQRGERMGMNFQYTYAPESFRWLL